MKQELETAHLVINATPIGMWPKVHASPLPTGFSLKNASLAFDLVYNPRVTEFLTAAEIRGIQVENGREMLIFQALESLKIWRGEDFDEDVFISNAREVLNAALS